MWATFDLKNARDQLAASVAGRAFEHPLGQEVTTLRFPAGLFLVRGDRAEPGASLAKQVVSSFGYWNHDAGKYFDMVFLGWGKDGDTIVFNREAFLHCRQQVETISRWRYSGETDVVLLNFECTRRSDRTWTQGDFSFEEVIWLPVEAMIRGGQITSLDALMHELITLAKDAWSEGSAAGVWYISDRIAYYRGRRAVWDRLKKLLLRDWSKVYDELRPFAVCDLRP